MFLTDMRNRGKTACSIKNAKSNVSEFLRVVSKENVTDITKCDIDTYLAYLIEKGNADSSRKTKMNYVKMFFNYLEDREICKNIAKNVKIDAEKKELVCPTIEDAKKILYEAIKNIDDFAIFYTLLTSGIRVSELIKLKVSDINDRGFMVYGKGKKERFVALQKNTIEVLNDYISKTRNRIRKMSREEFDKERNNSCRFYKDYNSYLEEMDDVAKNNYVFVTTTGAKMNDNSVNIRLKRMARAAGVDESIVSAHKIRHIYATNLLEQGVDMDVISKLLGHSNVAITHAVYAKTSDKRMQQAVDSVDMLGGI